MITGQWNPHKNPKDNRGFESIADIVNDIADRALGGYCDFSDDPTTYPYSRQFSLANTAMHTLATTFMIVHAQRRLEKR